MKIKKKENTTFKLTVTEKELDAIQLAVSLMLQSEHTHANWKTLLTPLRDQMRKAIGTYND